MVVTTAERSVAVHRAAWLVTLRRYLAWSAGLHLVWELAQLPLYTIWTERSLAYNLYAVAHCTLGDVLIAGSALTAALVLVGSSGWPRQRAGPVTLCAVATGAGYTVYSELVNTGVRLTWAYADAMPVLPGLGTGLAPLAQWLLLPPLALRLARR